MLSRMTGALVKSAAGSDFVRIAEASGRMHFHFRDRADETSQKSK